MNDIIRNKYVLGGLTLGDIRDKIKGLEVDIDSVIYPVARISGEVLELWETTDRCYDNEAADRTIDLDSPIYIKDGAVILLDELTGFKETMVFGETKFVQTRIEIL
jgi:hypothetical protein